MNKNLLIIGDPIKSLSYSGDSSLALAQGGRDLGYRVYWTTSEHISLLNGSPVVSQRVEILQTNENSAPTLRQAENDLLSLSEFERTLIRKDPPFDENYTDLCWILSQGDPRKIINNPRSLLVFHEKLTPWQLCAEGIIPQHMMVPTLVSQDVAKIVTFAQEQWEHCSSFLSALPGFTEFENFEFQILCKPWRGHGGRGIQTFGSLDTMRAWLSAESKKPLLETPIIVQPFLPQITRDGDRRVFIVNGQVAFQFVRRPAPGRVEANLAQGGTASLEHLPNEIKSASESIATYLKKHGILIAGIDFIGDFLTEVNITSPTGIRTFETLADVDIATQICENLFKE